MTEVSFHKKKKKKKKTPQKEKETNSYMTLRPGGILLPLPTMDHKPEKKNNRRTASVE